MENYKEEIAKLQTQLDELKSKIETPQFEVGKWYNNESNTFLFCYQGETSYGFGNTNNYEIDLDTASLTPRFYHLATPKEVEDALIKEAVKRGFKDGVSIINVNGKKDKVGDNYFFGRNKLYTNGYNDNAILMDEYGKWATPIKTKTIDEIAEDLSVLSKDGIISYMSSSENKQEIIETLNNL